MCYFQNHVDNSGSNGARVAHFIQNLPGTPHVVRNDFSEIGINAAPVGGAAASLSDDTVSIISATAAVHVSQNHVSTGLYAKGLNDKI